VRVDEHAIPSHVKDFMEILAVLERRGEEKRGKGSRMKGKFRVTKSLARPNQLNLVSLAPNPANVLEETER